MYTVVIWFRRNPLAKYLLANFDMHLYNTPRLNLLFWSAFAAIKPLQIIFPNKVLTVANMRTFM